jgi:UPF0755 protein
MNLFYNALTIEKMADKKKRKRILKAILILLAVLIAGGGIVGYKYYHLIFKVNVDLGDKESVIFFIPTGSDFNDVKTLLISENILIDKSSFEWLAEKKGYTSNVKPGRYQIKNHMTNNSLINMLRSGRQESVKVTFNNIRTRDQLSQKIGQLLETDSASINELLNNKTYLEDKYNMTPDEIMCIFIPNTYEFYWNTSAEEFVDRMHKEYEKFWNDERRKKAEDMGLDPIKVTILASIVEQETKKIDEVPKIAGVYMNRLNSGMLLQACPTAIYAVGDFTLKRVLKWHTEVESPYNTYIHKGLPPGPICLPPPTVIDKTLDYEKSDYLFFCAKEDFSGYHNFAKTNAQHEQNAARYQQALQKEINKRKQKESAAKH